MTDRLQTIDLDLTGIKRNSIKNLIEINVSDQCLVRANGDCPDQKASPLCHKCNIAHADCLTISRRLGGIPSDYASTGTKLLVTDPIVRRSKQIGWFAYECNGDNDNVSFRFITPSE